MPLTEMGSDPALISTGGQLGEALQGQQNKEQAQSNQEAQTALGQQAPPSQQKIKIDKQMAAGLGDPSLEGTSWDPHLLMAVTKIHGASDYHQKAIDAGLLKEEKKGDTAKSVAEIRAGATTGAAKTRADAETGSATIRSKGAVDSAKVGAQGRVDAAKVSAGAKKGVQTAKQDGSSAWFKKMQDSGKALIAAQQKKGGLPATGMGADIKNAVFGKDPGDAAKLGTLKQMVMEYRVAKDNYNKKAQAEGLAPQPSDPAADAAMDALVGQTTQQDNLKQQPNATTTKLPGLD